MRGAKLLAETMEDAGMEYAFGLAGSAILGMLDEIEQSDVEFVMARHEQVATSMAAGYALASRRPTATIAHVGPGAANQILGTAAANRDNIPLITISGNEPSHRLGRDVRHEWDVTGIFEKFTKHNVRVREDDAAQQLRDALNQSVSGIPGAVHIDFPRDLEEADVDGPSEKDREKLRSKDLRASTVRARPTENAVEEAAELLADAEKPLVVAGNEVRWFDATEPLLALAEAAEVPVAATKNARGAIPESNPLSLGLVGRPGMEPTNDYLASADLVIGVGTRFSDITTLNWELLDPDATIVHATLRARELDRQYVADVNAFGDVASFCRELTEAVEGEGLSFAEVAAESRADWEEARETFLDPEVEPAENGLDPRKLVNAIDDGAADDYAFCTGGGVHAHFPRRTIVDDINGQFVTGNFAGMSQGFPLAMGAQLAMPDRQMFCFEGDGGFSMVMQDLETAARADIPVKIVILNNNSYMSQRARQRRYYGERYTGSTFDNPDFGEVAEDFGVPGRSIDEDEEIPEAVEWFLAEDGPALLEARIDPWLDTGDYDRD
jgi:acetolactate synthase-1/2/3 large subunit